MTRAAKRALLAATLVAACGGGTQTAPATPAKDAGERVRAFELAEDEVLRDLAALDRRVAQRARIVPREDDLRRIAMAAVLAEDPSVAVVDGAIDPFSFEARAHGLEAVKRKVAAMPGDLPPSANGMTPAPAFERELLARLVDEEVLRLEEERALPRSASALVRAVVETWSPPRSPQEIGERDRWIARRLGELRESMTKATLDTVRARELDDALDALEHLIDAPGFQKSTAELVRVREVLEAQGSRPPDGARSDWEDVARRMRAHLGLVATADALERELDRAEKDLRKRAEAALAAANVGRDVLVPRLATIVFARGECVDAVPGSRVRSMAATAERVGVCHLRHFVAGAEDDASRAIALAAMHDHVVVAQWALDVARGKGALAQATNAHALFALADPDTQARLERIAQARPVMALAAGEAVSILLATDDPAKQARAWNDLGDVPIDVARKELQLRPTDGERAAK